MATRTTLTALTALAALTGCGPKAAAPEAGSGAVAASAAATASAAASAATAVAVRDPYGGAFTLDVSLPTVAPAKAGGKNANKWADLADGRSVALKLSDTYVSDKNWPTFASATVQDGQLHFSGETPQSAMGYLVTDKRMFGPLILERGALKATMDADGETRQSGGALQQLVLGYQAEPAFIESKQRFDAQVKGFYAHINPRDAAALEAADAKAEALTNPTTQHAEKVLASDATPIVKLFTLLAHPRTELAQRRRVIAQLADALPGNAGVARLQRRLQDQEAAHATQAGTAFHDVEVEDASGKRQKLSTVLASRRVVLLDFWASWCHPCRAEFPHLRKLYEKHQADGFEIFAVSVDDDKDAWRKASGEEKITWLDHWAGEKGESSEAASQYGVQSTGIPATYLIGQDGKIIGKDLQGDALDAAVNQAMREAKAAGAKASS